MKISLIMEASISLKLGGQGSYKMLCKHSNWDKNNKMECEWARLIVSAWGQSENEHHSKTLIYFIDFFLNIGSAPTLS